MLTCIKRLKDLFTKTKNKKALKELHAYQNMHYPHMHCKALAELVGLMTVVIGTVWYKGEVLEVEMSAEDFEFEFFERDALLVIWHHFTQTLGMQEGLIIVQLNSENGFSDTFYPMWLDGYGMDVYLNKPKQQEGSNVGSKT